MFLLLGNSPGGVLGLMFAGYVPLASQSPHPILVYFLANYRPHLSHFFIVQFNKQLSDLFNWESSHFDSLLTPKIREFATPF